MMESGSIHTRRGDSSRSSTYAYGRYSSYPAGGGSSQRRPVTNSASRSGRFPEQTRPDGGIDVQYSHSPSGLAASPYEYRNEEDDILNSKIGIYGWRKRCLYFFLVSVAVVLILNLALLVWITRIMRLNLDGMGKLRIHTDHVTVEGRTEFARGLFTQTVTSEREEALRVLSNQGVNITAGDAYIQLGSQNIDARAGSFEVRDSSGATYFSVNPSRLTTSADSVILNGSRGAAFQDFIQTREVRAEPGRTLQLLSPSSAMTLRGGSGLNVLASGSGISLTSPSSIQFNAGMGNISINSSNLLLPQLPIAISNGFTAAVASNVYEVCACRSSGKLFLAPPTTAGNTSPCHAASNVC